MAVKNYNQDYAKWAMEKVKNEVIANTDTKPAFTTPILSYIFSKGNEQTAPGATAPEATVPPTTATTGQPSLPAHLQFGGNAIPGTPTMDDIKKAYESWAPVAGSPVVKPSVTIPTATEQLIERVVSSSRTPSGQESNGSGESTHTATEDGFAKWLETDPAMQARMRQAESDYYRNRAGYGVQGENLAQSGLIGSGWDSHLDATAYAAMQAEKAGVRSEGYAKWLGDQEAAKAESAASADGLNTDAQTVFSYLVEQGKESITDTDLSYLYGLGYSKDAIDKAVTAYNDYSAKSKSEASNTFKDSFNTLMGDGTAADFLGSLGVSTEGMTEDEINATTDAAIEQAFKDGTLTAEERSAYYKAGQILDEDTSLWGLKEMAEKTANSVANAKTYLDEGKLTQADYNEILKTAYDKLGVSEIKVGVAGEALSSLSAINITVNVNGKERTYAIDRAGKMDITDKAYLNKLNTLFGDSPLAVYNDKCYFQYADGKWVEIGVKAGWGSPGTKEEGNDALRVVAEYVNASGMKLATDIIDTGNPRAPTAKQAYIR